MNLMQGDMADGTFRADNVMITGLPAGCAAPSRWGSGPKMRRSLT